MILTVTLNAALDVTYEVPRLAPHRSHQAGPGTERPGGTGLNVSRALTDLGHEVVATGFAGGATGATVRTLLAGTAVHDAFVPCAADSRRILRIVDRSGGGPTHFHEPGPHISTGEWERFLIEYSKTLPQARAVALCGSLPPGLPVGAYAQLVRAARAARVPVLLDTAGEPLRRGIAARPDVARPTVEALAQLTGARDPLAAARAARRRGAHAVVTALGPNGLLATTGEGSWQAIPPGPAEGEGAAGAGDCATAGLLSALVEGENWPSRLARATAVAATALPPPASRAFDTGAYPALLADVVVSALTPDPGPGPSTRP
ncbi:1-phosphofructokinase family hexose kinase [Streptomyces sp. NPDC006879]|uniref:1-phosphofructokinase family hexose kinase n=1 Tax=Streptomyces sp. NPDC006879 TaxID=3364767 RepID=UPI0036A3062B